MNRRVAAASRRARNRRTSSAGASRPSANASTLAATSAGVGPVEQRQADVGGAEHVVREGARGLADLHAEHGRPELAQQLAGLDAAGQREVARRARRAARRRARRRARSTATTRPARSACATSAGSPRPTPRGSRRAAVPVDGGRSVAASSHSSATASASSTCRVWRGRERRVAAGGGLLPGEVVGHLPVDGVVARRGRAGPGPARTPAGARRGRRAGRRRRPSRRGRSRAPAARGSRRRRRHPASRASPAPRRARHHRLRGRRSCRGSRGPPATIGPAANHGNRAAQERGMVGEQIRSGRSTRRGRRTAPDAAADDVVVVGPRTDRGRDRRRVGRARADGRRAAGARARTTCSPVPTVVVLVAHPGDLVALRRQGPTRAGGGRRRAHAARRSPPRGPSARGTSWRSRRRSCTARGRTVPSIHDADPLPRADEAARDGLVGDLLAVEAVLERGTPPQGPARHGAAAGGASSGAGVDTFVTRHFEAPRLLTVRGAVRPVAVRARRGPRGRRAVRGRRTGSPGALTVGRGRRARARAGRGGRRDAADRAGRGHGVRHRRAAAPGRACCPRRPPSSRSSSTRGPSRPTGCARRAGSRAGRAPPAWTCCSRACRAGSRWPGGGWARATRRRSVRRGRRSRSSAPPRCGVRRGRAAAGA